MNTSSSNENNHQTINSQSNLEYKMTQKSAEEKCFVIVKIDIFAHRWQHKVVSLKYPVLKMK